MRCHRIRLDDILGFAVFYCTFAAYCRNVECWNTIYHLLIFADFADLWIEIYSAITRFRRDSMAQCSVLGHKSQTWTDFCDIVESIKYLTILAKFGTLTSKRYVQNQILKNSQWPAKWKRPLYFVFGDFITVGAQAMRLDIFWKGVTSLYDKKR